MSKVNESYIIGVDIEEDHDISTLVVIKRKGDRFEAVNTFFGKEAEVIYKKISTPGKGLDTSEAGAQCYYNILKERYCGETLLFETDIVSVIGYRGLQTLIENRYIAECRSTNSRRLYLLCNRGKENDSERME